MQAISRCRACQHEELTEILNLGSTPLANSYLRKEELSKPEFKAPLAVLFCQHCSLLQLSCTVAPEDLFRNYLYFSSFSDTMLQHVKELCTRLVKERELTPTSLVVEIASNDGYLLKNYKKAGIQTLGVEPALNIAETARREGIETIAEFFDSKLATQIVETKGKADIIHAHNVFAHVPDINEITKGIGLLLKDNGVAIIEVPYAVKMIDQVEFDTIYHEHVFYFTATALNNLFKQNNLVLSNIEQVKVHGGSLRLFITKTGVPSATVESLLREEHLKNFDKASGYQSFKEKVESLKLELIGLLKNLKAQNKRLAIYGASAKGSTLLNYFGLGAEVFDFVVDRSTAKQGLFTPGTKLPIYSPVELITKKPDYVLLLTWNFADEILQQQAEYLKRGGKFIIPIPQPKVVGAEILTETVHA